MALPDGLYDLLLTERLARSLTDIDPSRADVSALKGQATERLTDLITRQLASILGDVSGDEAEKARRQLELVNGLLVMLRQRLAGSSADGASATGEVVDLVAPPLRVLRAVQRDLQFPVSPEIGLGVPWLFTAGKGSPSLLQEIRRELASSDQVDILVSFITVSGVRKLQDVLQQITAKGARQDGQAQPKTRLRILTTTYTGSTEARALDELARVLHRGGRLCLAAILAPPRPVAGRSRRQSPAGAASAGPSCAGRPVFQLAPVHHLDLLLHRLQAGPA